MFCGEAVQDSSVSHDLCFYCLFVCSCTPSSIWQLSPYVSGSGRNGTLAAYVTFEKNVFKVLPCFGLGYRALASATGPSKMQIPSQGQWEANLKD